MRSTYSGFWSAPSSRKRSPKRPSCSHSKECWRKACDLEHAGSIATPDIEKCPAIAAAAAIAGTPDGAALKPWRPRIAVRGRGAALFRLRLSGFIARHIEQPLAPFEAALMKILSSLRPRLLLPMPDPHHHRVDMAVDGLAFGDLGRGAQILDPAVGAGAMKTRSSLMSWILVPAFRPCSSARDAWRAAWLRRRSVGIGTAPDRHDVFGEVPRSRSAAAWRRPA